MLNLRILIKVCVILQITLFWFSIVCKCDVTVGVNLTATNNEEVKTIDENQLIRDNLLIVKRIMDSNTNPCEDFFEYACKNYMKDMYNVGIYPNVADNQYIELAFSDQSVLFESALKAKNFYESCLSRGNLKDMLSKVNVLKSIDRWPVSSSTNNSTWMRISEELKLLDLDPLLEVGYDDFGMIEVYSGNDILTPEYNDRDIDELNRTLLLLDIPSNEIQIVVEDIINFTKSRALIIESASRCVSCEDDHQEWRAVNLYYDLKTFKKEFSQIDWDSYLRIVFGRDFNETEPIKIMRKKTTKPYLELLVRTDPKTITNYAVWTLIKGIQKLGNVEESCGSKTFGLFESIMTAIYSKILFTPNDRSRYLQILDRFENAFENVKLRYNNVPYKRHFLYVLTKERRFINALDTTFSIEKLNDDFNNVTIDPNNYFQNLINLGQQRKCNLVERECMDRLDLMLFLFEVVSMHNKPTYFSFSNKYYYLWETVIQHYLTRRRLNTTQFQEAKNCAKIQADHMSLNGESNKSVIITAALRQTLEDYDKWLKENENLAPNEIFQEFNLNSKKVFFLNFVQGHCNQKEKIKWTIRQSLTNLDEFSQVFDCPSGSNMNAETKCRL